LERQRKTDPLNSNEPRGWPAPQFRDHAVTQRGVFYYTTLMNENYAQPDLPAGAEDDAIRFCYKFGSNQFIFDGGYGYELLKEVTLPGSGSILAALWARAS